MTEALATEVKPEKNRRINHIAKEAGSENPVSDVWNGERRLFDRELDEIRETILKKKS